MADVGSIDIKIRIDTRQLQKAVGNVQRQTKKLSGNFTNVTKGVAQMKQGFSKLGRVMSRVAIIGFAAIAGAAVKALKEFGNFEQRIADVSTLISGDTTEAMATLSDGILELTKSVPKSADELGASAYAIVSAGITDMNEVLEVTEFSAKLATAGLGTTEEATTLMVLALNNFRDSGLSTSEVSDVLFKTVRGGITTIAELSQSFGLVAPLAVDAGVSFIELQAATAALTAVNKSASISQNSIKAALVSLGKPTAEATKLFDKLGVKTFKELIKNSGGMVAAFEDMKDATEGNDTQFAKAIGSGEALSSVLALLGPQADSFTESMELMTEGANAVDEAFEKQKATLLNQIQLIKNRVIGIFIKLGEVMFEEVQERMPKIQEAFEKFKEELGFGENAAEDFRDMFGLMVDKFIDFLPTIGSIVDSIKTFVTNVVTFALNHPNITKAVTALLLLNGLGITSIAVGFAKLVTNLLILIGPAILTGLITLGTAIATLSLPVLIVIATVTALILIIIQAIGLIKDLKGAREAEARAEATLERGRERFAGDPDKAREFEERLARSARAAGGLIGKKFATGTDSVPAMLTPGEMVLNKRQQRNLFGSLGGNTTSVSNNFNISGSMNPRLISNLVVRNITQSI